VDAARRFAQVLIVAFPVALAPWLGRADTVQPGQTRVVTGVITAIDVAHRSVVLEVPAPKGDMTIGVTLATGVEPQTNGAPLPLSQVAVGASAELRYTREDGRLIGLRLDVRP